MFWCDIKPCGSQIMNLDSVSWLLLGGGIVIGIVACGLLVSRISSHKFKQLQQLTDALPVFISYIGPDYRYRFVNKAYCRFFDRRRQEILSQPIINTVGEGIYKTIEQRIKRALEGEHQAFETKPESLPGREFSVEYIPDYDHRGKVCGVFALTEEITAVKERERELEDQAMRDALTGLLNRRGLHIKIFGFEASSPLVLAYIDLDHFKRINDEHGHQVGDEILKDVARAIEIQCRTGDIVARVGGDEFVVVLQSEIDEAHLIAARMQRAIGALQDSDPRCAGMHASIGLVSTKPDALDEALCHADRLLYQSKVDGRGRITVEQRQSGMR